MNIIDRDEYNGLLAITTLQSFLSQKVELIRIYRIIIDTYIIIR